MKAVLISTYLMLFFVAPAQSSELCVVAVEQLIKDVLHANAEIKTKHNYIEQSEARLDGMKSKFAPKLLINVSQFKEDKSTTFVGIAGQEGWTSKLSAQWNLFNGFQDKNRFEQRSLEVEKARSDYALTSFNVRDQAIASIFRLLSLQYDEQNIAKKISIEKDRENDLKKRVLLQSVKRSDLLAIQASIHGSISDLQNTKAEMIGEWKTLSQIAGVDLEICSIKTPDFAHHRFSKVIKPEKLFEVASARLDAESARYAYLATKGQLWPVVDLSYNRYLSRPEIQKDNQWDFQISASFAIPVDGEKTSAIREARKAREQKEIIYQNIIHTKKTENEKLQSFYELDQERYETLTKAVAIQESLVNALYRDHQAGLVGISDYLNSITSLLQKRQLRDHLKVLQYQRLLQLENVFKQAGE